MQQYLEQIEIIWKSILNKTNIIKPLVMEDRQFNARTLVL